MRAVVIEQSGGPEVLSVQEVAAPVPGSGDVLVDVAATSVNRADLLQRQGFYPPPPGASELPGLECSGRVAALGAGVAGFAVGDEVCALLTGGGYAEQVVVPAGQVMPVPDGVDLVTAAGLPETVCTVWSNLVDVARLRAGEWLLVHGGAGGIGTTAIQVARALGAHVAVTASGPKLERCAELGAQVCIDYAEQDFVSEVRDATGGRGVDVVLDSIGARYLALNVDALARNGRLVVIGMQGGRRAEVDLNALLVKNAVLTATSLRSRPVEEKAAICAAVVENVWPMVSDGRVKVVVDRVLPLAEAADAHRVVGDSAHVGKVLLATS